ncbi:MAG: hypothetical protein AAB865_02575 [Patescibacteria group bacterium]
MRSAEDTLAARPKRLARETEEAVMIGFTFLVTFTTVVPLIVAANLFCRLEIATGVGLAPFVGSVLALGRRYLWLISHTSTWT